MVVEDSADVRYLVRFHLEQAGVGVRSVDDNDWQRLLDVHAWAGIDAAVVDLNLKSEVNGVAVLCFLRDHLPHIRRIVFTATVHADDHDDAYEEAIALGDAFVSKFELASKLVEAVGR